MMKAYKGFDKDLKCRGFQFEIGKEYEEEEASLCNKGFHACENPLDCFNYYAPGTSRFCEVEIEDNGERNKEDSKVCGKKIKIGAELNVAQICKAHFEYVSSRCVPSKSNVAGDQESASAGRYGSASAGNSGSASAGEWGSASAGRYGSASAGKNGIACALGGKVKGEIGCAICATEMDRYGNNISVKAAIVDGEKIKADTWYTVKNGEFVEVG
jgi:LysM repeat protein